MQPQTIRRSLLALAFTVSAVSSLGPLPARAGDVAPPKVPFKVGETLHYRATYGLLNAGTASLSVKEIVEIDSRATYHCVFTMKTQPGFFFRIDDTLDTFIDVETLLPRRHIVRIREGDRVKHRIFDFDQAKHRGTYRDLLKKREVVFRLAPEVHDALSFFYYLRVLDYEVGRIHSIPATENRKSYVLRLHVRAAERRNLYGGGVWDTMRLEPKAEAEEGLVRRGQAWIWISRDDAKIPVLIRTKLTFGYITLALTRIENPPDGLQGQPATERPTTNFRPRTPRQLR